MSNKNSTIIKGLAITVGTILICVLAFLISIKSNKNNSEYESTEEANKIVETAQKESAEVKENERKSYNEINVSTYLKMYDKDENSIVLIGSPKCHYCEMAEPIIQNVAYKYNLIINYINVDNFSGDDEAKFTSSDKALSNGFGTPLLLVVGNKKIVDQLSGLTSAKYYEGFFKTNGFID